MVNYRNAFVLTNLQVTDGPPPPDHIVITYLAHDDHVGTVLLQEGEGLPLPEVEPVGKHDVEAELRHVNVTLCYMVTVRSCDKLWFTLT